jgi:glycosyltransferase involved in cell wall biosynthesis
MSGPLVSVIIPTYNRRRWIGECLDAVLGQTYPHIETLVVDDGSGDGTVEWLRSERRYASTIIHVQPQNRGACEARNAGIRLARGELIAFIDSDDMLASNHIETAVGILRENPQVGLFCCDSTIIGPEGRVLHGGRTWHEIQSDIHSFPVRSGLRSLKDIFLFSNCFPGFTLRREVFEKIGLFNQSAFPMEDYDFALRLAGGGYRVYYHHEPLALRRDHVSQSSGAANAVWVCSQKLRTLRATLERNPELRALGPVVRRRLAQVHIELGVSRIRAGQHIRGVGTLLLAIATSPAEAAEVIRLGRRRLQAARFL